MPCSEVRNQNTVPTGVRATTSIGLGDRPQDRPRLPALNVLVNNAGIMLRENLLDPAELPVAEESLRIQLAGAEAGVQVIEVVPSGVCTTLLGQQDSEQSMPLDDFLTETLDLLREKPNAKELVVEPARFIRDAVANGSYDNILAMISGSSLFRQRSCSASSTTRSRLETSTATVRCASWPR